MFAQKAVQFSVIACVGLLGCRESGATHDHAHGDPDEAAHSMTLNDGKPWQTDAPLRAGMVAIRDQLQAAIPPIHSGAYSTDDYKALAGRIDTEIGTIISHCKLPPAADAQLHLIITQLVAGTDLMKKEGDRKAGAAKAIKGLQSYAKFFDHPDWKPIAH